MPKFKAEYVVSSLQKIVLSLLITVLIFAFCCAFAFTGGFSLVEMRFYEPLLVHNMQTRLSEISHEYDNYIEEMQNQFADYTLDKVISSYIEREPSVIDMASRGRITSELFQSTPALEGIRLVGQDGIHIHFSSFEDDILSKTEDLIAYKNYTALQEIPFSVLSTQDTGSYAVTRAERIAQSALFFDTEHSRFIFSFPFFDAYTTYRGTVLFYVFADDFTRRIVSLNMASISARERLIAPKSIDIKIQTPENSGFVYGLPTVGNTVLAQEIAAAWQNKKYGEEALVQGKDDRLILLTDTSSRFAKIGWLCSESDFTFSDMEKMVILSCLFISIFLLVFMLFCIKRDDMLIIRTKVNKFELELFKEYLERKSAGNWKALEKEIESMQQDINYEVIKSLGRVGKRHHKEVNALMDQSWRELFALIAGGSASYAEFSQGAHQQNVVTEGAGTQEVVQKGEETEELEELEAAPEDEAEELEELEEVGDDDGLEELESVDDEDCATLEEIPEDEDAQELEEIPVAPPPASEGIKAVLETEFSALSFDDLDSTVDYNEWRDKNPKTNTEYSDK